MTRTSHRSSLANVRTHTTRKTSPALQQHELYMKLTSLEIERSRRATERRATSERLANIDSRIATIEAEQSHIKSILAETEQAEAKRAATSTQDRPAVKQAKNSGLNLQY